MAGFVVFFIMIFVIVVLALEKWWSLFMSIISGDSKYLQNDILESGICENKRKGWIPLQKAWWNMTPDEREKDRLERQKQFQMNRKTNKKPYFVVPANTQSQVQPKYLPLPHKCKELNDLEEQLLNELDL